MNEQIQTWLLIQLEKASVVVDQAATFVAGELPLFVQEFLTFNAVWHWIGVTVGALLLLISIVIFRHFKKMYVEMYEKNRYDDYRGLQWAWALIVTVPGLIFFFNNLYWACMITFAPRVYLLTTFMGFFNK